MPDPMFEVHSAAHIFPLLPESELAALAADISVNGLIDPIVTTGGLVLDGRNRLLACKRAGVEPRFVEWTGTGSPTSYVVSVNAVRRHLTEQQKAAAAVKASVLFAEEAKERQRTSAPGVYGGKPLGPESAQAVGRAREQASEMFGGVSHSYFSAAKRLRAEAPELFEEVALGTKTIRAAMEEIGRGETLGGSARKTAARPDERGTGRRLRRSDPLSAYNLETGERPRQVAEAEHGRFVSGLAEATSILRGLTEADFGAVIAVMPSEDLEAWIKRLTLSTTDIRKIINDLKEARRNG